MRIKEERKLDFTVICFETDETTQFASVWGFLVQKSITSITSKKNGLRLRPEMSKIQEFT